MSKKILVVDDDQGILDAFRAILDSSDYIVDTASTKEDLMKYLKKNPPNLIILDVLLSGADGREICKDLKSKKRTKDIPIIIVSAHPSANSSIKQAGADDFLSKPFDMEDLLSKIDKLIS